jgi:diketogulonate reductase-like aldo/keto reductase
VVLAWLMGGQPPMIPVVGASSVAQLDELLGAVDLRLDDEARKRLDADGRHGGDWDARPATTSPGAWPSGAGPSTSRP